MSLMYKKPPYCLAEFVTRGDMNFDQCIWAALMDHCFFGFEWEKTVNKALKILWSEGGTTHAQGYRYYLFQFKNPLVEFEKVGVE